MFFSVVSDEHLETLVQLLPSESVTFRQHKLIHYPRVLKSSGPFLYQSVLRYERKHQFFKRLTHNICNFKNICKNLAIRHQVNEYFNWKDDIPIKQNIFPCCKQGFVSDSLISTNEKYRSCFSESECLQSSNAVIMGTRYGWNDVLILDVDHENSYPKFVLIQKVLICEPRVFFSCFELKTVKYQEKSRSYCVSINYQAGLVLVAFDDPFDFHPLSLHKCAVVDCFYEHVVLRHTLKYNNYASNFKFL